MGGQLIYYLTAAIVFGVVGVVVATARGQSPLLGFLLGFFFSCLGIGVLLVLHPGSRAPAIPPPHPNSQWLDDPTGRHQHRLWDGQRWTAHVSDDGRAGFDPLPDGP